MCVRACTQQEAQCVGSSLSQKEEHVEALKAECSDVSCRIQSLQAETESIRALVSHSFNSLNKSIPDQSQINNLLNKLITT